MEPQWLSLTRGREKRESERERDRQRERARDRAREREREREKKNKQKRGRKRRLVTKVTSAVVALGRQGRWSEALQAALGTRNAAWT